MVPLTIEVQEPAAEDAATVTVEAGPAEQAVEVGDE